MTLSVNSSGIPIGYSSDAADSRKRDLAIDNIRGLAILMVIGIHALSQPLDSGWGKVIDAALRPAVPLFLFVSGYLSGRSMRVPVLKRIKAALIPYTIAFCAAYVYMAAHNPVMDHRAWVGATRYLLGYVLVYYYVPIYIGCTLLLGLVFRLRDRASDDVRDAGLAVALSLMILFGIVSGAYLDPLLARLGFSHDLIEEARLRDIPFWFAFMAAGTLVALTRIDETLGKFVLLLLPSAIIGLAIYAAIRVGNLGDAAAYDSVAFLAYAMALCLLLLATISSSQWLAFIGSGSYFIYLWHIFIVMMIRDHAARINPVIDSAITYVAATGLTLTALVAIRFGLPPRVVRWLGA
ncbi:acyltransferase [Afipia sp. P52-10]|uniref:acyltransferase family protein n=1 Tax=Afipia sp. P52-10 TaxID=1429916 RepID=UPI0003DF2E03|nr:acyltransferase [Afipia sp. P52-10]ETR76721.1 acyltransferase [Afipia sp. P52-10]